MAIPTKRVSKVIISGEWFSVELGTFQIEDFTMTEEDGTPLHEPLGIKAYRFLTPNRDEYYGPLSAIELIKLLDL